MTNRTENQIISDLNWTMTGKPGGPTLLLVHPMGAEQGFWGDCLPYWTDRYACLTVDLRGAGRSPAGCEPLTIELLAKDLETVCAQASVEKVAPVGCAIGSMVAARFAHFNPHMCAALVMSNPDLKTQETARAALISRIEKVRAGGMIATMPDAIEWAFNEGPHDSRRQSYTKQFLDQDPTSYAFQVEGILEADISDTLGALKCPVLLVGGGKDRLLPVDVHAHAIAREIDDCDYVLFEEGAHFIPYQMPQKFTAVVRDFLDRRLV